MLVYIFLAQIIDGKRHRDCKKIPPGVYDLVFRSKTLCCG